MAHAQSSADTSTTSTPAKAKTTKARQKRPATSQETGLAMATAALESLNDNQREIAKRVFVGRVHCDQGKSVDVEPVQDKPGVFHLTFNGEHFMMVPEETSSGAVRLFDKAQGVVWLQIPVKSMLMNQKKGQRMIDGCKAPQQDGALQASSMNLTSP